MFIKTFLFCFVLKTKNWFLIPSLNCYVLTSVLLENNKDGEITSYYFVDANNSCYENKDSFKYVLRVVSFNMF